MADKIMLVEDDTNLSEIYKARLEAEGLTVIAARDGEEALALAVKEHPNLIISDIMMPKISGFDMLDILRGTEGIKNTKVIMMTALGQAEDKERAAKLGADRYLVKSQVTLEDVVKTVHDVLNENSPPATTSPATNVTAPVSSPPNNSASTSATDDTQPDSNKSMQSTADSQSSTENAEASAIKSQIQNFVSEAAASSTPTTTTPPPPDQPAAPAAAPTAVPTPITVTASDSDDEDKPPVIANKKIVQPPSAPKLDLSKSAEQLAADSPKVINDISPTVT